MSFVCKKRTYNWLQKYKSFKISVSHTTRSPRSNEVNGVDYNFISHDEFLNTDFYRMVRVRHVQRELSNCLWESRDQRSKNFPPVLGRVRAHLITSASPSWPKTTLSRCQGDAVSILGGLKELDLRRFFIEHSLLCPIISVTPRSASCSRCWWW